MKKILAFVVFSSLLVLFGCGKTPTSLDSNGEKITQKFETYESKTHQFALQFPDGREFQENVYGSHVMFFTPLGKNDTLRENIGIMKKETDQAYDLEDYYNLTKPELETNIPNFVEVSKETISINGVEGHKLIYQGTQGDFKLQWQQNYFIKDTSVYIITYTATPKTFDEFATQVDAMIATLEIK